MRKVILEKTDKTSRADIQSADFVYEKAGDYFKIIKSQWGDYERDLIPLRMLNIYINKASEITSDESHEIMRNETALDILNLLEDYGMLKPCSDEKTSIVLCEIVEKLKGVL